MRNLRRFYSFKRLNIWPLKVLFLIFLFLSAIINSTNAIDINVSSYKELLLKFASENFESFAYHIGVGEQCPYVNNPSIAVREHLQENLKAQDHAIESIVAAIESWEFAYKSAKTRQPLVLAITGPTGTGKTETSNLIAEGLFKRTMRLPNSDHHIPSGLMIFRGEDFSDKSSSPITAYHAQIKKRLADHLSLCSGKAIVVFDEVQKVIPHTLDVFLDAMSPRAQFTYYKDGKTKQFDTSNVIFILVSDIGVEDMEHIMVQYASRNEVPIIRLEKAVKKALDDQWSRLVFGKMISQVIPFLPMEPQNIADIITLKLIQMDKDYHGRTWQRLWFHEDIPNHLSRLDSIIYEQRFATINGEATSRKIYAKYGARNVENGPIQQIKSKLLRYLKPINAEADVRITLDTQTDEVSIISCDVRQIDTETCLVENNEDCGCIIKWKGKLV